MPDFLTDTGVNIQDFKAATKKLILATPVDKNGKLYEHHQPSCHEDLDLASG